MVYRETGRDRVKLGTVVGGSLEAESMKEQASGRVAPALWEALSNNRWEAAEVLEAELDYADGGRYIGASILELRKGEVTKEADYFAQPFTAPKCRAQWVEKM